MIFLNQPAENVAPSQLRGRREHERLPPFAMWHAQAEPAVGPLDSVVLDALRRQRGHRQEPMSPHRPQADKLSASIMCSRLGELANEVHKLEGAGIDSIHIDVMDGHFVPNLTFGPDIVAVLRCATSLPLHVHLMVTDPGAYVRRFAEAGANTVYFHIEAERYPWRLAAQIGEAGMTPGIALNPSTAVDLIRHIDVPHVLVMAVEPGFAGQRWLPPTVHRVRELSQITRGRVGIGVDGNVSPENARLAKAAGASLFVCGTSSLFSGDDYASEVRRMRTALSFDESPSRHSAS